MDKLEKRKAWERLIADRGKSSLSVSEWCEKHGVTERQLEYWRKRLRELASREAAEPGQCGTGLASGDIPNAPKGGSSTRVEWTPVQVVPESRYEDRSADIYNGGITIRIGAAQIEVRSGFDRVLLGDVLKVVSAIC